MFLILNSYQPLTLYLQYNLLNAMIFNKGGLTELFLKQTHDRSSITGPHRWSHSIVDLIFLHYVHKMKLTSIGEPSLEGPKGGHSFIQLFWDFDYWLVNGGWLLYCWPQFNRASTVSVKKMKLTCFLGIDFSIWLPGYGIFQQIKQFSGH